MRSRFLLTLSASACFLILVTLIHFPSKNQKQDSGNVGEFYETIQENDLSGEINFSDTQGMYEGQNIAVPYTALLNEKQYVLGANNENKWIEVDLSEQKIRAWEGDSLYLESLVSTGLPYFPTPEGEFRIWTKLRASRMHGGTGRYAYDLPNVPYVMFMSNAEVPGWRGYSLHGTYWHNDFGRVHSHGCVNLPTEVAKQIYYWVNPELPEGKSSIQATPENQGTRIVIHA